MRDIVEIDCRIPDVGGRLDQVEYEEVYDTESHYNAIVRCKQISSEAIEAEKRCNERRGMHYEVYNWAYNKNVEI